jgi:DNA-binding transcriptional regulator YiaG
MSELTKKAVRETLGVDTDSALAQVFNVSRAAVAQWDEDKPIPPARQMWLRLHMPDKFPPPQRQGAV